MSPADRHTIEATVRRVRLRSISLRALFAVVVALAAMAGVIFAGAVVESVADRTYGGFGWLAATVGLFTATVLLLHGWMSRGETAYFIDHALELKDRVASSLAFVRVERPRPIHQLQIADTARHLGTVGVGRLVPWHWRRDMSVCGLAVVLAMLSFLPQSAQDAVAIPVPPAPSFMVDASERLEEGLEELERAVEEAGDEALMDTLADLERLAESMKEPGRTAETALVTLGQMQNALQMAAQRLDIARQEAVLAEMAEAMSRHAATQPVAAALEEQDYREAAERMEALAEQAADPSQQFAEQNEAMANDAANLAEQAQQADWSKMAEALQEMQEALENKDGAQCRSAMNQQSGEMRKTAGRKELAKMMQQQMNQFAQCKSRMSAACRSPGMAGREGDREGSGEGRNGQGKKPGQGRSEQRDYTEQVSQQDSQSAGLGEHGAPYGEETELQSLRQEESLTGRMNDQGSSMIQIETAPEMTQFAARGYRDVYSRYRKMSEEVIEQEEVPLSYQPIVTRYFEAIRPRSNEGDDRE